MKMRAAVLAVATVGVLTACAKDSATPDTSNAMSADSVAAPSAPQAMAEPDAEMKAVLDELAALNGKPAPRKDGEAHDTAPWCNDDDALRERRGG